MPTKDNELTEKEKTWIRKFRALLRSQPKGIELIVTYDSIDIYPSGTMGKHLGSRYDTHGMSSNPEIRELELLSFNTKIIPYTEGL